MNLEEVFVGVVAIVLGLCGVATAIANWDGCYQSAKIRWIETLGGRRAARIAFAVVGVLLIALGTAIAMGFGPNKSSSRAEPSSWDVFSGQPAQSPG